MNSVAIDLPQLAVADLASDDLVGDVGLFLSEDGRSSELGLTLARAEQGQGHANRAAEMAAELLLRHAPVLEVRAIADQRQQASVAVLRRAGFVQTGTREALFKEEACTELRFERRRTACDPLGPDVDAGGSRSSSTGPC